GGEVESGQRHRAVAAARVRGTRSRAFQRADRALSATVRRRKYAGCEPFDGGTVLPRSETARAAGTQQAVDSDNAKEPASASRGGVDDRAVHQRRILTGDSGCIR